MPYVTANLNLPRSIDVQISLSRPQTELRTNLTILCVACENLGFLPDSTRLRYYSTIEAVEEDFAVGSEAHFAASAFFSQTPRATKMAIGEVFLDDQAAVLASASLTAAEIALLAAVDDGEVDIVYMNPDDSAASTVSLTALDFTGATSMTNIAAVIQAAIGAELTCQTKTLPGGTEIITITTVATGDGATISFPVDPEGAGTYIGELLKMSLATGGKVLNGYTSEGIGGELTNIANAANQANQYIYGWTLGSSLREAAIQEAAATWALARTAFMTLVTNDVLALDSTYTDDIGSVIAATGNRRVSCIYHDNAQRYPDVSILAYMLHVNYQIKDSTVTAKFKQLPGIETVELTETEWSVLQSKGYNTYTAVGNAARTYRDGMTDDTSWYMDTVINLDNFVEDLSVAVFNVFLRNKKIPYTRLGQMLLVDACKDTGNQYQYNGTFADREVADTTQKSGISLVPAVQVIPTPISNMSVADRAARIGPPIEMIVQEAGAIHSVAINVEVVS